MHISILLPVFTTLLRLTSAQQAADGLIVPFTSDLPACASLCGKLFDVQGACTPPVVATTSTACFCGDPRLQPFLQSGTQGVSNVCGAASCTDQKDLQAIQSWYQSYCGIKQATATSGSPSQTGTSGSSGSAQQSTNNTWFSGHYKWVVALIILIVAIVGGWVGACYFRRRYLRKKEREIEMRPPVAWGPHQLQGATGGYSYGDGVANSAQGGLSNVKGYNKEAVATPANTYNKRESRGWLRKSKF